MAQTLTNGVRGAGRLVIPGSRRAEALALARRVAAAQVDLIRIRKARSSVLASDPMFASDSQLPSLLAIDRYERRALSRRKFAIREFDAACPACEKPTNTQKNGTREAPRDK